MRHIVIVAGLVLFLTNGSLITDTIIAVGFFAALTTAAAAATRTPGVMSFLNVGSLMATGYYIANAINGFLLTIVIDSLTPFDTRATRNWSDLVDEPRVTTAYGASSGKKVYRIVAML
ncbi:hypothetical protein MPER_00883 [Moniliophthora perniciosa FA553]|nr:hypothetical protein MPER_00883 [Moniliophthora perniciosa FA553]